MQLRQKSYFQKEENSQTPLKTKHQTRNVISELRYAVQRHNQYHYNWIQSKKSEQIALQFCKTLSELDVFNCS